MGKKLSSTNVNGTICNDYGTIIVSDSGTNGAVINNSRFPALASSSTAIINGGKFEGWSFAIQNTGNMTITYAECGATVINSKGTLVIEDGNINNVVSYDDTIIKGGYYSSGITAMGGKVTIEYCTLDANLFVNGGTISVVGGNYKNEPTDYVDEEACYVYYDETTQYYIVSAKTQNS